jgi:hypothetical protein
MSPRNSQILSLLVPLIIAWIAVEEVRGIALAAIRGAREKKEPDQHPTPMGSRLLRVRKARPPGAPMVST